MNLHEQDPASPSDYRTKRPDKFDFCPSCNIPKWKKQRLCTKCRLSARTTIEQPDNPSMGHIRLTHNQFAIVDAHLYEWLNGYRWQALWNKHTQSYYPTGRVEGENVRMNRLIVGLGPDDPRHIDHEDSGQTLDNRGCNLRIARREENARNRRMNRNNRSGFKGVYAVPGGKYAAKIRVDGKAIYLGLRDTAEAAHRELYVPAASAHHGEFARLA